MRQVLDLRDVTERARAAKEARANGLALVPELGPIPAQVRRHSHRLAGLLLTILVFTIVSATFVGFWYGPSRLKELHQESVDAARLPMADLADYRDSAGSLPIGWASQPVVLTYHDVAEHSPSEYVVTPTAFARQIRMLHEAGYHSMNAEQMVAYLQGTYTPPPRSVLITFDDGTRGLYSYADGVLKRYGFSATSFLITGRVGTHKPYYLTWGEIQRMEASGRWTFESHTRNSHTKILVHGEERSLISARREGESEVAFEHRVTSDLRGSLTDFIDHGLPRPQLFAWPFSDVGPDKSASPSSTYSAGEVLRLFKTSFVDNALDPVPVTPAEIQDGYLARNEVFANTTARGLFESLQRMRTLPVSQLNPLQLDTTWREDGGHLAPVTFPAPGQISVDASTLKFVAANWAPQRTSDWTNYQIQANISNLQATTNAGLKVRVNHDQDLSVRISRFQAAVAATDGQVLASAAVQADLPSHHVSVQVSPTQTVFSVDGRTVTTMPVTNPGSAQLGGFGIIVGRDLTSSPFPVLSDLQVQPW